MISYLLWFFDRRSSFALRNRSCTICPYLRGLQIHTSCLKVPLVGYLPKIYKLWEFVFFYPSICRLRTPPLASSRYKTKKEDMPFYISLENSLCERKQARNLNFVKAFDLTFEKKHL